jgi:hypothetical protein
LACASRLSAGGGGFVAALGVIHSRLWIVFEMVLKRLPATGCSGRLATQPAGGSFLAAVFFDFFSAGVALRAVAVGDPLVEPVAVPRPSPQPA